MPRRLLYVMQATNIITQTLINYLFFLDRLKTMPFDQALQLSIVVYAVCLIVGVAIAYVAYALSQRN